MPARGERDKADPTLIVGIARIPQPSKRLRGLDYPATVSQVERNRTESEKR